MKKYLVSIIIPIYNAEKFLSDCIESVLNQTYNNIEVLLIDDGSKDRSLEICSSYQKLDNRIKVVSLKNSGPGAARNKGIETANGDYIIFVDSDDMIESIMVKKLLFEAIKNNSEVTVCGIEFIAPNDHIKKVYYKKIHVNTKNRVIETFINLICHGVGYSPCCKLYKLDLIKNNNISFNEKIRLGEDAFFNISVFNKAESVSVLPETYYKYFSRDDSLVSKYYFNKDDIELALYKSTYEMIKDLKDMKLIRILNSYYLYELSFVFLNYFKKDCSLNFKKKYKKFKKIINNSSVVKITHYSDCYTSFQKIIKLLVKNKMVVLLLYFCSLISKVEVKDEN